MGAKMWRHTEHECAVRLLAKYESLGRGTMRGIGDYIEHEKETGNDDLAFLLRHRSIQSVTHYVSRLGRKRIAQAVSGKPVAQPKEEAIRTVNPRGKQRDPRVWGAAEAMADAFLAQTTFRQGRFFDEQVRLGTPEARILLESRSSKAAQEKFRQAVARKRNSAIRAAAATPAAYHPSTFLDRASDPTRLADAILEVLSTVESVRKNASLIARALAVLTQGNTEASAAAWRALSK